MTEPTPDIQAILARLAQFAPPEQQTNGLSTPEEESVDSAMSNRLAPPQSLQAAEVVSRDVSMRPQSRSTASPKPMIDPATITTWQDGLRCVTKIAAQNAQFAASIKGMMDDQRKHEMRWFSERQALKHTQSNRAKSFLEAQSILQSLSKGANAPSAPAAVNGVVDSDKELAALDRKIYEAQRGMEESMEAELKGLGVPFFGTDRSLISSDEDEMSLKSSRADQAKWSPPITETQLMELRRRMVGHLEDLYRD